MSLTPQTAIFSAVGNSITVSDLTGVSGIGLQIDGTWRGQIVLEASHDGARFSKVAQASAIVEASGNRWINVTGFAAFRVRAQNWDSGAASVSVLAYSSAAPVASTLIFKTATCGASGDNALWTPAAGKKFRLLGYQVHVGDALLSVTPALRDVSLRDATTAIGIVVPVTVPAALATYSSAPYVVLPGNGYLSALANNVLNANLSGALLSGAIRVNVCGYEE